MEQFQELLERMSQLNSSKREESSLKNNLGRRLLEEFFTQHNSPIDIAIVLSGGLRYAYYLEDYLNENNLLFYMPKTSHKRETHEAFLQGDSHPERTLLIVDVDIVTGAVMRETVNYFIEAGYNISRIYGYLHADCKWRGPGPYLMHIDDLLPK